jgi:polysaccharide pyruvyl transferase WcaK-like protein
VDVNFQTDNLAKGTPYPFSNLLDELNKAKNKANVLVVDACRSPPETTEAAQATRDAYGSATRVIQRVVNVPEDLFIMYSTAS